MKKIIVLSPGIDQALAIARFIRKYGNEWILHGGLLPSEKLFSRRLARYYEKLVNIRSFKELEVYDCVLPTGAKSTYWMATQIGDFYVNELLYSKNNLQCFDKCNFIRYVATLGIPVPKTYTYENVKQGNVAYPLFYKPKFEGGGGRRGIAYSKKHLERLLNKDKLIFQEYIPGSTTYGVGFIAKNGRIITSFQHEELLSFPIQGGSAVYLRRFNDEKLLTYTQTIIEHIKFSGWGLAEFKYCHKRRDYVFMEINAKLWASIEFALLNNNKFLKYMFDIDHPIIYTHDALFIERFIVLDLQHLLQNAPYLFRSEKIIKYHSTMDLPIIFIYNYLTSIVKKVKGFYQLQT